MANRPPADGATRPDPATPPPHAERLAGAGTSRGDRGPGPTLPQRPTAHAATDAGRPLSRL